MMILFLSKCFRNVQVHKMHKQIKRGWQRNMMLESCKHKGMQTVFHLQSEITLQNWSSIKLLNQRLYKYKGTLIKLILKVCVVMRDLIYYPLKQWDWWFFFCTSLNIFTINAHSVGSVNALMPMPKWAPKKWMFCLDNRDTKWKWKKCPFTHVWAQLAMLTGLWYTSRQMGQENWLSRLSPGAAAAAPFCCWCCLSWAADTKLRNIAIVNTDRRMNH